MNQVYKFIPNGIALEKYAFDLTIREKVRRDLGVENKFVIGHAGRFNVQKNHEYLIDVFASLHKECNDAVLLLFGDGELRESMQQKVKSCIWKKAYISWEPLMRCKKCTKQWMFL